MRAVVQRVSSASVVVEGQTIASIGTGLLVLVGVHVQDEQHDAERLAHRIASMRIFADEAGKMNLSIQTMIEQHRAQVLAVPNFTLYGDASQRRPSFTQSAPAERALSLFNEFVESLCGLGVPVQTGRFGAMMDVSLVNTGPVTLVLDTR